MGRLLRFHIRQNVPAKTRILFLRKTTEFGGSEAVLLELLKAIDYTTSSVYFASSVDVLSSYCTKLHLPVTCVPLTAAFDGSFLGVFISWLRYFARIAPDKIILAEGAFRDFALAPALAAFANAPGNVWIMELHPPPEPTEENAGIRWGFIPLNFRERVKVSLARGVLSVSHGVKERLVRSYGYARQKVTVVYNGVDTGRFTPASEDRRSALRGKLQISDEAVVVVSTARLDRNKRLDRLIRAFGALKVPNDLWLFLTGAGPMRAELQTFARSLPNSHRIRFLGHVDDVRSILRASDIYVLPSDEEAFGIALAEAMACELLCVATKTIGPSEIVEDGISGFLVALTDDGVLEGLNRALALSPKERKALGQRARQRIVNHFGVEKSATEGLAFMEINSAAGRPR
jgi:glycosyltransferase involved in cell wall biosynthesis